MRAPAHPSFGSPPRLARAAGAAALALIAPRAALAHGGAEAAGWGDWSADPWALVPLLLGGGLYAAGLTRLWARAGRGRGAPVERAAAFAVGFLVTALALLSPLDAIAGDLFSVHMVQHVLLMLVAAPLLVVGRPAAVFLWGFPKPWRPALGRLGRGWTGALWRALTSPLGAWATFLLVLWTWHIPGLYQAALVRADVHALQHVSFTLASLLFWTAVLERPRGAGRGAAVIAIFTTAVHGCALGALLTLSSRLWYPLYAERVGAWGLTPLEDQQLGGLVMWVPPGAIFVGAALAILARMLNEAEAPRGAAS